ncbi:MAG: hypothetical protein LBL65_01530 [Campylobacteraceae bacterium]|jgi:hypothetical protein|nr:hypothetical protein [Campylobacteraceae bacterium]
MKTVLKLSIALTIALTVTSCSNNSSNSYTSTGPYYGGETVDGYTLPPMPNPKTNDKTLLGTDTNDNGIRDDVEIYIYNRFQGYVNSKVEREIAMQYAKAYQQVLISPETAYEDRKYEIEDRVITCEFYYYDQYLKNVSYEEELTYHIKHNVFNPEFKDIVFNTKDRLKTFFRYNKSMSGHVFEGYQGNKKEACDFDPDPLIEGTL